jgi:predicted RNA-binding protein Jag
LEPVATRLQQPSSPLAKEEDSSAEPLANSQSESKSEEEAELPQDPEGLLRIYPYGVSRFHLEQVIQTLQLPAQVTKDLDEADIVLALRSQVRSRSKIQQLAHSRQIPIHTVKANTLIALAGALRRILNIESEEGAQSDLELFIQASTAEEAEALEEARLAVEQIVIPKSQPVELLPRSAHIRKLQHQLVESYHLRAQSFGEEPNRRLRIYPN